MLQSLDGRKLRMEAFGKGLRYDFPINQTRKMIVDFILSDHTYARHSSLDPEFNRIHSTCLLFTKPEYEPSEAEADGGDIDVVTTDEKKGPSIGFDATEGKKQMSELEQCFYSLQREEAWQEEDQFSRSGWTRDQSRLFDQVHKVLSTYRLARCTYEEHPNEQILRGLALEKTAKRFRNIAAAAAWDAKAMSWLHTTLVDGLNSYMFLCYLELLQTLKAKIPSLIEKMMHIATPREDKSMLLDSPDLVKSLSKAWDPTPNIESKKKVQDQQPTIAQEPKLDNKPLLIMLPRGPAVNMTHPKRFKFWQNQLGSVGKMMQLNMLDVEKTDDFAASAYLENIIGGTRTKISLFQSQYPGRGVILIGWSIGALLSCKVATVENIAGIICLGYPSFGIDGSREIETDNCLDVRCPIMFVVGTHSSTCSAEYIETLRERMRVDTRLLLVEGGDEMLKLTSSHKKRLQMNQNMIDRMIMDEVEAFINEILTKSDKAKEPSRPNTPTGSGHQFKSGDRKRKTKNLEMEKDVIERKKQKISPGDKKSHIGTKKGASHGVKGKVDSLEHNPDDSLMTPVELTMAATKNLASNASPIGRPRSSQSLGGSSSSLSMSAGSAAGKSQITKLLVKGHHEKYSEKSTKKGRAPKKPLPISRSFSSPTQQGITQADYAALQKFPTTSSILLSSSGAHLRLHDGRILRVSGSDLSKPQPGIPISTGIALQRQAAASNNTPAPSKADASKAGPAGPKVQTSTSKVQPLFGVTSPTKSFSGFANLAATSVKSPALNIDSQADKPGANRTKITSAELTASTSLISTISSGIITSLHTNHTISRSLSSPATSFNTQLSQSDLKYLTGLFTKSQGEASMPSGTSSIGTATSTATQDATDVPNSPISAKIGIGTLTNLPNPDGSPPGSGTRVSPGSKSSPQKDPRENTNDSKAVGSKGSLPASDSVNSRNVNAMTPKMKPQASTVDKKLFQDGQYAPKNTPVTITIPTHTKSHSSNSPLSLDKPLAKITRVFSSNTAGKPNTIAVTSSSQPNSQLSKLGISQAAVDLSKIIKKATSAVPTPTPVKRQTISISATTASPAKLTVTSRSIQNHANRGNKNPQTITLHIPNTAMLKDHKNLRGSGSEIKLIGLLNQQGRSPLSSPIHFSVQSKSAPGSPQPHSPSIVFTPKSGPPTPTHTPPPTKQVVDLESKITGKQIVSTSKETAGQSHATVQVTGPKPASASSESKNGSPAVKFTMASNIQSALIKSLSTATLSAKQKESIAHLLKNQGFIKEHGKKGKEEEKLLSDIIRIEQIPKKQEAAKNLKDKIIIIDDDAKSDISFVNDQKVPKVEICQNSKDGSASEVNGHCVKGGAQNRGGADMAPSGKQNRDGAGVAPNGKQNKSGADVGPNGKHSDVCSPEIKSQVVTEESTSVNKQAKINQHPKEIILDKELKVDVSIGDIQAIINDKAIPKTKTNIDLAADVNSKAVNSAAGTLKRQKRLREVDLLRQDGTNDSEDDVGPSPRKRLTRQKSSSANGKQQINAQKTEE